MKSIKVLLIVMAACLITLGLSGISLALHDGGVAHCDACHTMHNSEGGESIITGGTAGMAGEHLLLGSDPSSTCLNCHGPSTTGRYHILSTDGSNKTPGGDFYWMTKSFTYESHGTHVSKASNHGHNVIALDYGLDQDEDLTEAPGGEGYQAGWLSCASCHDPHGKTDRVGSIAGSGSYGDDPAALDPGQIYGNFRLLGDASYDGGVGDLYDFNSAAPIAAAPGWNDIQETDTSHTDYGRGMAEWCGNCHQKFLTESSIGHVHPAGNAEDLGGTIAANYNAYVRTGDLTGNSDSSYLQFVRFERGTSDVTQLNPTGEFADDGPNGSANVMCLTCHRAHASAFPNAGNWFFESEFLEDSVPGPVLTGGASADEISNAYYARDMQTEFYDHKQRSLCNKCHVKD